MAAADVAEFLWRKFLRSLENSKSELSGSVDLFSNFVAIKHILVNTKTFPFSLENSVPWNVSWEMNVYIQVNTYLTELNYALAESCVFTTESKELNNKILVINPSMMYFILKMMWRLATLKKKFVTLIFNSRELLQEERKKVVKGLGLATKTIVAMKKNSEEIFVLSDAASSPKIESLLVGGADDISFTAVGIVGMAGVGKSAFVRNLFEYQSVSSVYSPIVWLYLSEIVPENQLEEITSMDESVNISIVTNLLKKLGDDEEVQTGVSGVGLNLLLERLNYLLLGKRYLIVLDDVRRINNFFSDIGTDDFPELQVGQKNRDRLSHGLPKDSGGAVIITSRTTEVAQDIVGLRQRTMNKQLTTLKRNSIMSLLKQQDHKPPNIPSISALTGIAAVKKNLYELMVLPGASTGKIEQLILREVDGNGFTAIGIVGMAGIGKSMMVLDVLDFSSVWSEFSPIVWLCLSDIIPEKQVALDNNHRIGVSISIVTCILDKLGEEETSFSGQGLDLLLERLNSLLSGRRYLIVLDDVWHTMEFYSDLCSKLPEGEKFGARLSHGLPKDCGGAVIVMSRITEVAQDMVGKNNVFLAKPWDRGWCWVQFRYFNDKKVQRYSMSNLDTVEKVQNEILDQICGLPSIAMALAELIAEKQISDDTDDHGSGLKNMLIPREFLIHRSYIYVPVNERNVKWVDDKSEIPKCPVFVFVDLNIGPFPGRLLQEFRNQLNQEQVIAVLDNRFVNRHKIGTEEPEKVLKEFYSILEKLKSEGHHFAGEIEKKMTIIIVGGDVFANWFLGVICDLKLPSSPSIVPVALGFKADIASSLGWEFDVDKVTVNKILATVLNSAKKMKTDSWHILMKIKPTAYQEIPYCFHSFHQVHETDIVNVEDPTLIYGGFWNYFSLGVDDPRLYGASRFRHTSRNLSSALAKVEVLKNQGDQWEELSIPCSIKSIVCLNLPSFLGGLTPWTAANIKKDQRRGMTASFIDDGHLEIIGSKDDLLSQKKRWIRLDQVQEIRFKFTEDSVTVVNITIDGVPWKQSPLDGLLEIEISYHCQVNVLVKQDHSAKSIHGSSQPCGSEINDDNDREYSQTHKTFGAASSFKMPEDDISC